jgi:hypothetical protein
VGWIREGDWKDRGDWDERMVVGLSGRSRTTGQLLPAGLISRRVHHLRYPLHGGGGGGGVNRTASYSPTCPAREEEARVGVGDVVRKSRTYDDDLQDHHDRRTHRHSSHTYRHGSRSSTPNNHDTARSSTPPTMFTRRDSTTATAKTPRTTTSTLADIVSGRASSSQRKSKTRESRGKASSSSSSGGGRADASINASSSAAAVNHHGISSTSSPPNHPQHPFDEEDPSLQSSKKASTTRTNRLSPPQPDLIEIAYSYSLLEGDSVVTGDHESAKQDVAVDNDEKHATDEDEEIASPPRRLVHASSQQYGSRRQVPNLDTAKEEIARSISSSAEVLQRYQVELQSNNNSSRGTPMRLTKDDVQELVRAIHDISDCVNSLKNAVLPADAHHDQITMMKDVDISLRARSSLSDRRDRRPRAGDASASSLSTSTNRSSNHHHHHHSPTSAAAIYGKNLHRRGHRHHFPKESRQSSCEHSSYSNSSSNYGTVITPPPPLPRRSLPDFLLRQQETPLAANTSKRRLRSLSSTKPVGACTSSTRASTTVDVARPPNYRRATSLVATLSKASVSAEFLARTIQQQFKNGSSTNSNKIKHSQLRRRAELQQDDDGDDDEDEIALHNDEEDELEIWQHDDVPVMQNVNHDKKARNNIGTPETDATTTTTTSNSGPTHTNDLNRMNSWLFDNAISGGIADDNTNDDDDATRDFYQQQQQHDAESRSGSGSGGLAYQSFRPQCDERSRGRGGGVHSYYGMSTGKRRAPGVPCITTCLPVSNFYTDYVESFTVRAHLQLCVVV